MRCDFSFSTWGNGIAFKHTQSKSARCPCDKSFRATFGKTSTQIEVAGT
jgi:hypothetical protein